MIRHILPVLLLCATLAPVAARAEQDQVQFFSNIHVAPGSAIHDAVCFFCSVDIEGQATGDIVVFFGNVHVASSADHDLVSMFGNIRLGDNVHIGEDLVAMFGTLHAADNISVEGDRVVQPAWLFYGPMIFLVVVLVLVIREFRAWRRRNYLRTWGYPPRP